MANGLWLPTTTNMLDLKYKVPPECTRVFESQMYLALLIIIDRSTAFGTEYAV